MCLWIYLDALSGPGAGDLLVPGGQPVGVGCLLLLERALKSLQDVLNIEKYTRIEYENLFCLTRKFCLLTG